ncbi:MULTISPECIES: ABC transporter substrate-binding protein [unclassified Herbaspirillum]|uniref:ABC transporter substrate-binding protein n=1 Tax=unclassified Herbaspirillum TaxID=2624150 RepID=UPI001169A07F|nr:MULTISPECIES: ABC transporter substrate-binding protein [unclassified Herbaspirillum]MBB5393787.1 branched-chain amino acid transport system substrate-binding protein [Herbaspirillum sp. SJZ102]TQK01353.1 amino acid/amide ABC transporter substrate-binding protein (HAAT family) [Herbaspirillum sp. SJZ130]TQK05749.1 amino acid/amide ABC transporter substrate-binding protein (HAAT family) [Herbaspirillum sp. SJZ106]TWC65121.1 amino acid/amide ABC transporter substrate-binding protein (HAAT fami
MALNFLKYSLVAAGAALVTMAAPVRADEIRVGVIASFSGPYSNWGKNIQEATDYFLAQNGGKVGNHTIKVIYRDVGGNNPARARQLAEELVVRDKVQYLAGLEFTPTALAVTDVATQAKVPTIVNNSGTSGILSRSPYLLRAGYTQWMVATPLAKWVAEQGGKKVFLAAADYAPGIDAINSFRRAFTEAGGAISGEAKIPMNTTDFSTYMQKIKEANPEYLYMFMPVGPMSVAFIKSFVERGLGTSGIKLLATAETEESELPAYGDAASGVVTALHYSAAGTEPANAAFVAGLQKKYGADRIPNVASVSAYDSMTMIAEMIRATDGKPDGDKAMAAIKGYGWDSPRGPVKVDPETRELIQNVYIRRIEKVNGKYVNKPFKTYPAVRDPGVKVQ